MDARHLLLVRETQDARDRAEAEECEDVVAVARRNVEKVADDILTNQRERREIARLLDAEGAEVKRAEEEWRRRLMSEVGRLTRNVILLQTRLLILEEKRFERDKLFAKVCQAEEQLASLDEHHANALKEAHQEQRVKYEKLYGVLEERIRLVSDCAGRVGCSQQIAALRERYLRIMATQTRLRKVEALMLDLHRQNRRMTEEMGIVKRELKAAGNLAQKLLEKAGKARKDLQSFVEFLDEEEASDSIEELETKFKSLILELETKVFQRNDQVHQLNEIVADQKCYQRALNEEDLRRRAMQKRLIGMSRVAELVMGDTHATQEQPQENLSGRSTYLAEMSTIMLEVTSNSEKIDETHPQIEIDSNGRFPYMKGFLGIIPEKSTIFRSKSHSSLFSMESKTDQ